MPFSFLTNLKITKSLSKLDFLQEFTRIENMNKQMLQIAINVARLAGDRLNGISKRSVNSDLGRDVKLQEDVESEMFIRELLSESGIPVIGEEQGGDTSIIESGKPYWVVDPIDGSYNFLRGMPGVCVSIGLMRGWEAEVGVIYDFTRGEIFAGGKDLPFTINGEEFKPKWANDISQAALMCGFPHSPSLEDERLKEFLCLADKFKKVRIIGSAALAMAWVAAGRADAFVEKGLYLWDVAGGLALMKSLKKPCYLTPIPTKDCPMRVAVRAGAKEEFLSV